MADNRTRDIFNTRFGHRLDLWGSVPISTAVDSNNPLKDSGRPVRYIDNYILCYELYYIQLKNNNLTVAAMPVSRAHIPNEILVNEGSSVTVQSKQNVVLGISGIACDDQNNLFIGVGPYAPDRYFGDTVYVFSNGSFVNVFDLKEGS